ncbi:alpha/beta hydrolase [Streptomyces sp. 8N616]|uniref:alpha/beta hydrolase n=1 Tax=Streptomyces sp. 8N616 TaxID=3457414 RepID=UPI003FCF2245
MSSGPEAEFVLPCVSSITSGVRQVRRRTWLLTEDGVRIEAAYEPWAGAPGTPGTSGTRGAPGGTAGPAAGATDGGGDGTTPRGDLAIVIAHGFSGSLHRPALQRAARTFAQHTAVITFSFRGHGRSGGRSTVGDREVLDVAAVVRWARSLGHARVATVGFSMGGSVVIRHAALYRSAAAAVRAYGGSSSGAQEHPEHGGRTDSLPPGRAAVAAHAPAGTHTDAVVAISAPARWYYRGTAPMRRLHWVVQRRLGRLVGRFGLRTRIHPKDWDPVPLAPVEAVPLIPPVPLLIVHGDRDPYFPLDHPHSLADAAPDGAAELWIEADLGHAENAADPTLLHRIAEWLVAAR